MTINGTKLGKILARTIAAAALTATSALATSCGTVFDDLPPCRGGVELRFVFDYNLEEANSFHKQVDCLTLYLYDSDGRYVATLGEDAPALASEDYRMNLDLEPGRYRAVAYGGTRCDQASFATVEEPAAGSHYTELASALKPEHVGKLLHNHYHGTLDFTVPQPSPAGRVKETLNLKRTTNHFRVTLQHTDNSPVEGSKFDYYIIDDNALLDHENNPVATGNPTTYTHWTRGVLPGSKADGEGAAAYGELSTSRVMTGTSPKLRVENNQTGETVLEIPLIRYLEASQSDASDYPDQEYLDRCSQWNLIFFLNGNDKWGRTEVIINDWVVRFNDIEMN